MSTGPSRAGISSTKRCAIAGGRTASSAPQMTSAGLSQRAKRFADAVHRRRVRMVGLGRGRARGTRARPPSTPASGTARRTRRGSRRSARAPCPALDEPRDVELAADAPHDLAEAQPRLARRRGPPPMPVSRMTSRSTRSACSTAKRRPIGPPQSWTTSVDVRAGRAPPRAASIDVDVAVVRVPADDPSACPSGRSRSGRARPRAVRRDDRRDDVPPEERRRRLAVQEQHRRARRPRRRSASTAVEVEPGRSSRSDMRPDGLRPTARPRSSDAARRRKLARLRRRACSARARHLDRRSPLSAAAAATGADDADDARDRERELACRPRAHSQPAKSPATGPVPLKA